MTAEHQLVAQHVRDALAGRRQRIVLVESCTAGRVAATLAVVPGISAWLCGSFVVYRNESKAQWLGIPRQLLDDPEIGPVSAQVTSLLARQALMATDEADVAVAVTGHIGPGCPPEMDGQVYCCVQRRGDAVGWDAAMRLSQPAPTGPADLADAWPVWTKPPSGSCAALLHSCEIAGPITTRKCTFGKNG